MCCGFNYVKYKDHTYTRTKYDVAGNPPNNVELVCESATRPWKMVAISWSYTHDQLDKKNAHL